MKPNYLTGTNTPYYWQVWGRNTYSYNFEKSEIRDFWIKGTASNTATTSETAKCYKDGDCGADYYVGDRFCLENNADPNNVYRNKTDVYCGNPGTKDSFCSTITKAEVVENCEQDEICKKQSSGGAICEITAPNPCAIIKCDREKYGALIDECIYNYYSSPTQYYITPSPSSGTISNSPNVVGYCIDKALEDMPLCGYIQGCSIYDSEKAYQDYLVQHYSDPDKVYNSSYVCTTAPWMAEYCKNPVPLKEGTQEFTSFITNCKSIILAEGFERGESRIYDPESFCTRIIKYNDGKWFCSTLGELKCNIPIHYNLFWECSKDTDGRAYGFILSKYGLVDGVYASEIVFSKAFDKSFDWRCELSGDKKKITFSNIVNVASSIAFNNLTDAMYNCSLIDSDTKIRCSIYGKTETYYLDPSTGEIIATSDSYNIPAIASDVVLAFVPFDEIVKSAKFIFPITMWTQKSGIRIFTKTGIKIHLPIDPVERLEGIKGALGSTESGQRLYEYMDKSSDEPSLFNTQDNPDFSSIAIDDQYVLDEKEIAKLPEGLTNIRCHASDDKLDMLFCYVSKSSYGTYLYITYVPNTAKITKDGGTFNYERLSLDFPQSAVSEDTIIKVKDTTDKDNFAIMSAYQEQKLLTKTIYDIEIRPHMLQFQKPVTMTISYNGLDFAGASEDNLGIYYYDESQLPYKWVKQPTEINRTAKTISVDINHFSKYALMEDLSKFKIEFSCAENQLFADNFDGTFNPYIWSAADYVGWLNPCAVNYGTRTFGNSEMTQTAYNGYEKAGQEVEYAIVTKNTYGYGAGGYNIMAEFKAKFTNPISIYRSNYVGFIRGSGSAGSGYNYFNPYGVAVTFDEKGPQFVTNNGNAVKTTPLQIDPTIYHTYQIIWTPWFAKLLVDGKLMALNVGNIPRTSLPFVVDSKAWMCGYSAQAVVDYAKLGTACVNPNELQELGITPTDAEAQQFGTPLPDIPPIVVDDYANDNKWVIAEQAVTLIAADDKGISAALYCIGTNCEPNIQAAAIGQNQYRINFTQDMDNVVRYLAIDTGSKKSRIGSFVIKLDKTKPTVNDNFDSDNVWIANDRTLTIYWNDNAEMDWARYCLGADCNIENGADIYNPNSTSAQLSFTEGISILRYGARDVAGNVSDAKTKTIKIDRGKPITTISIAGNKVILNPQDAISGIQRSYYRIDNSGWALSNEAILQEGKHTITYFSIDNANNSEEEKTETIVIDATAPTTTDSSNEDWHSNDQNITLTCSDATSGCYITRYCIRDEKDSCTPRTIGNSMIVDCAEGEVCRKAINYYSVDNAGNIESLKISKIVKIDKEAPLTADNASELWHNAAQEISLIAYDYGSGAKETLFCLDKSNECMPNQLHEGAITISDEGLTYLRYYSADNTNNVEDTKSAFVKIDKTAPITIDDSGEYWANADITITLNVNDELSGVRGTYYRTNGSSEIAGNAINITEEGEYAIAYYSDDYAGNTEEMKTTIARIDKTKPTISDDYANSGVWVNTDQTIMLAAEDNLSGIAEVKYCIGTDCIPEILLAAPYQLAFTTEQDTVVRYSATDNAGNISDIRQFNVKIDKTPPMLELNADPSTLWPPNKKEVDVFVSGSANDTLSGLKGITFAVQDEYNEISPALTAFNQSIKLTPWRDGNDKDGRQYTIIAKAFDNAGNVAEKQAKVMVPHDMSNK